MIKTILSNQQSFIIKLLAKHSMEVDEITNFSMNGSTCKVMFSTRSGLNHSQTIDTDDFTNWWEEITNVS